MPPRVRIVIPVKPLAASKSRLASRFSQECRARLALAMLCHVLKVAQSTAGIAEATVIGGDDIIRAVCRRLQLPWEPEPARGLNRCLQHAFRSGRQTGWDATVYLPADLPELSPRDLDCLLQLSRSARALVAAPDRFEQGTNALLVPTAISFEPMLGTESFHKHLAQARGLDMPVRVCRSEGLLLDIDTPSDLDVLLSRRPGWWLEVDEIIGSLGLAIQFENQARHATTP
ncbi:MAG: 2-phospho-L-lactate guanylyltransferase [Armatimonadota bacterium]